MICRLRHASIVSAILCGVLLGTMLAGCSGKSTDRTPSPEPEPAPPAAVAEPGLYERDGGQVGAIGIFARLEEQGGSWAVFGVADTETAQSFVVAIVEDVEGLGVDLATYRGRYVEVRGVRAEDSPSAPGTPVIRARSIEVLVEDDPDDPVL